MEEKKILIVDDNLSVRDSLADILEGEGFDVTQAGGVESAREKAGAEKFDVALIDLKLPDGDGATIGRALAEAGTFVIIITGYVDTAEDLHRKYDFTHIFKPIDIPYLLKVLKRLTGGGQ